MLKRKNNNTRSEKIWKFLAQLCNQDSGMCWHLSCTCLSVGHVTSLPPLEWFGMLSWRSGNQYDMKISFSVANGASLWGYSLPHEQSYASIGELWKKLVSFYLYVWACCVVSYLSNYLCKFPFPLPLRKHYFLKYISFTAKHSTMLLWQSNKY